MALVFFFSISSLNIDMLEIEFFKFFYLLFMKLSWSHDSGRGFNMLAQVDLGYFFYLFFQFNF
jgi:hypothetical protein